MRQQYSRHPPALDGSSRKVARNGPRFGQGIEIVGKQLLGSPPWRATPGRLAYEPIWAIGAGLIPTSEDVAAMRAIIRALLGEGYGEASARFRILYGGSVKPASARELLTPR